MTVPVALLMGMGVGGALIAVAVRNILHAVFGLAVALLACAGLFLYLNSPFVAAMEVLIYVGGISVAMVFAVMLSRAMSAEQPKEGIGRRLRALAGAGLFFAMTVFLFRRADLGPAPSLPEQDWSVARIGSALLTHYNLVFEALSVVLLLAILGAVAIAQRGVEQRPDGMKSRGAKTDGLSAKTSETAQTGQTSQANGGAA